MVLLIQPNGQHKPEVLGSLAALLKLLASAIRETPKETSLGQQLVLHDLFNCVNLLVRTNGMSSIESLSQTDHTLFVSLAYVFSSILENRIRGAVIAESKMAMSLFVIGALMHVT